MNLLQLLSAAGIGGVIGSLVTTLLQAYFTHKSALANRNFNEKKEAYVGFLEALHRSEVERTAEASARAGHWQNRCELVAPMKVRKHIYRIFETNPDKGVSHPERPEVITELKRAMRADLGVETE